MKGKNFGWALKQMKAGLKVRRKPYLGEWGIICSIDAKQEVLIEINAADPEKKKHITTAIEMFDILAEDWEIVK
jgi:hypothetical protein